MTAEFKPGDRVYVTDPSLAMLREIAESKTGKPSPPNHYGVVEEVHSSGYVFIKFDDGGNAPYPPKMVQLRKANR